MVIAHIVHMLVIPPIGALADRIGRKPVYFIGAVLAGTWGFFAFPMFDTKSPAIILLAICIGLIIHAFMYASQPAIMSEMFPTRMRYSGVSLGYQVTSIVAGSLAPIIAAALLQRFGSWVPVAIYLAIACGDHPRGGHLAARDEGFVAARTRSHRRGATCRGCRRRIGSRIVGLDGPWSPRCAPCVSGDSSSSGNPVRYSVDRGRTHRPTWLAVFTP
jgi:MFS family permease